MDEEALIAELARRRTKHGESRWPPAMAVVVAAVAYALLPSTLQYTPRFVIPAVELALLAAVIVTGPLA